MKKTSYFVFDPNSNVREGYKRCAWCHKEFKIPTYFNGYKKKYCSEECKKEAVAAQKKMWNTQHRDLLNERKRASYKAQIKPEKLKPPNSNQLVLLSVLRRKIIMKALEDYYLAPHQTYNIDMDIDYTGYFHTRHDPTIVNFIIDRCKKLGLYDDVNIKIDFSDDYIFDQSMLD